VFQLSPIHFSDSKSADINYILSLVVNPGQKFDWLKTHDKKLESDGNYETNARKWMLEAVSPLKILDKRLSIIWLLLLDAQLQATRAQYRCSQSN